MSEITEPLPAQPSRFRRLLLSDDGLRAGWSLLLFLLIAVALGRAFSYLAHHLHLLSGPIDAQALSPRNTVLSDGITLAVLLLDALLMSAIERRPFARYGLSLKRGLPDFLTGLLIGLGALSTLIAALWLTHAIEFTGLALQGTSAMVAALKWAAAFLLVGLAEEFATRGYLQFTVARGVAGIARAFNQNSRHAHAIGFWVAAGLFSVLLFMAGHLGNHGETPWGIAAVGLAGVTFAFSLYRTGTLWWAIGFHAAWDWAQSCLYGTPDSGLRAQGHLLASHPTGPALLSGGNAGPEGSLLVIPTLLCVILLIYVTLPRRPYPLTADQSPAHEG